MKRTLITLGLLFAAGCIVIPAGLIYGNGHQTVQARGVSGFLTITNHTSLPVRVHEGAAYSVTTTIDSNLQDELWVQRNGSELNIDVASGNSISPTGHPLVEITMPSFYGARVAGSGDMTIDGVTGAKDIDLTTVGSGSVAFDGTANTLTATANGSGSIDASGSAALLDAVVHGSGSIDARYLYAHSADLTTTGSGSIHTTVTGGDIWCRITGSGDVEYWGSGTIRLISDTGSGNLYYRGGAAE